MRYGFIGCGNMGGAVARAVCRGAGAQHVLLANRTAAKAQALPQSWGARRGQTPRPPPAILCFWASSRR